MNEITKQFVKENNIKLDFKGENYYKMPLFKGIDPNDTGNSKKYIFVEYNGSTELCISQYITKKDEAGNSKISLKTEEYILEPKDGKIEKISKPNS